MKFHTEALQFLVASEALRFGVRAQSVVVDRTLDTKVADAAASDFLLETPVDSGGRFSPNGINNLVVVVDPVTRDNGSSSTTGTMHHTIANTAVSDVLLETTLPVDSGASINNLRVVVDPVTRGDRYSSTTSDVLLETLLVDSGGRFSPSDIINYHAVVDPATRDDGSSSKTGTMYQPVADAAVSEVLLETLPADSGGRFFPTGINNLRVVDSVTSGDGSSSKTGTMHHTVAEAAVSDVLLEIPADAVVDSGTRYDGSSSKTGSMHHTVADAAVSDILLETPADSGGRFSGDGSSSKTGTTYHTVADAGVSDVLLETPADNGGRLSSGGSSSKTGTMHHTVADAGVSDVLLETLPADSGGRFSPSDIVNHHAVVDAINDDDGISTFTGTDGDTVLTLRKLSKSSKKVKPPHEDVLVSFVNDTITGEIISNVEDIDHPAPPRPIISATDKVSDYGGECRASEGCTCTAKHVYKSTRDCVLVQSTSTVSKNWDAFSKASCDRSYKLTAYDCNRCQNFVQHTDSGMVGNGSNRGITNRLRLNNGFKFSGLFLGASRTSKRDWCIKITDFYTEGNSIFAFDRDTSCTGRRSGGATSNNLYQFQKCKGNDRSEINAYQGHWVNIGTNAKPQIETRVTASNTATEQSIVQFTENWSLSGTVKFGKASVTASYGQTMQTTSQATLAQTNGFESALICTTTCNAEDYTYIYKVEGYDSNDARTWIDVPSCQFHCTDPVKDAHRHPKCPPLYCDPTRGTCQCCTSLEWADTDASDLPTLCDGF